MTEATGGGSVLVSSCKKNGKGWDGFSGAAALNDKLETSMRSCSSCFLVRLLIQSCGWSIVSGALPISRLS